MDWINHADVFLPRFGAVHYSLLLRQSWEAHLSPHVFLRSTSPTFADEPWRRFVPSFPFHAPHLMDCFEVREAPIRKASTGGENWMKLLPASWLQQGLCYEHIWICYILKFNCIHWMWIKFDKMWITYSQLWVTLAIACDTIPILALRWNLGRWFGCFPSYSALALKLATQFHRSQGGWSSRFMMHGMPGHPRNLGISMFLGWWRASFCRRGHGELTSCSCWKLQGKCHSRRWRETSCTFRKLMQYGGFLK